MIVFGIVVAWLILGWMVQYHFMGNFHFASKHTYENATWIDLASEVCLVILGPFFAVWLLFAGLVFVVGEFFFEEFWPIFRVVFWPFKPMYTMVAQIIRNIWKFLNSPIFRRKGKEVGEQYKFVQIPLRKPINYPEMLNKLVYVEEMPKGALSMYDIEESKAFGNDPQTMPNDSLEANEAAADAGLISLDETGEQEAYDDNQYDSR